MFRNQYDSDVTVWSPQGRIHQVEYAMEAVKQGSATIGLKNNEIAVLLAFKRASSELSAYQKKIITIDDHIGVSIAGLTADARMLSRYMRSECLNFKYAQQEPHPVGQLISHLSSKMQVCTQRYDRRPYGVGLLIAGYDDNGPHIYQICPSANYFECKAMAIGSRSQSARTYLEKFLDSFKTCTKQELLKHGLKALRDTLPNEIELNTKNVSIGIVGKGLKFNTLSESELQVYLSDLEGDGPRRPPPETASTTGTSEVGEGEGEPPAAPTSTETMDTD
ncbi:proteasome subunit alpha type-1 [Ctenocephalides felis]|uniref:proteasome subunit alpha type-1 n=1 Tax=Ctenocephalides felis TaxID=7515 RepID=UPI000E6E1C83|nr:proteasome subunit alpha type-1 [Ctenocephalides felis]